MPSSTINAAVVGASGYTGMELARLLHNHPNVNVDVFVSRAEAGRKVGDLIPSLESSAATFTTPSDADFSKCDAVFYATPSGVAMREAAAILEQGKVVIDLSPDFRLRDTNVFAEWYGEHSAPELLPRAVYGLSENAREQIKNADLIACPGCYATAVNLSLLPFAAAGLIDGAVIVDAKSGVSGAGKRADRADLLFAEQHGNFKAYSTTGHRHLPEMLQTITDAGAKDADLIFTPHLLPTARGIYSCAYIPLKNNAPPPAQVLSQHWQNAPFITVRDGEMPTLSQVVGSNRVRIGAQLTGKNKNTALIITALDNLLKGAAGQAVQNLNIRFALPETTGLI